MILISVCEAIYTSSVEVYDHDESSMHRNTYK